MFKQTKKGFSLVELLVVITIIVILSVVAYTALGGQTAKARDSRRVQDLSTLQSAIEIYFAENNRYPEPKAYNDASANWGFKGTAPSLKNTFTGTISGKIVTTPDGAGGGTLTIGAGDYNTYTIVKGTLDAAFLKKLLPKMPADPIFADLTDPDKKKLPETYGLGIYPYAVLKNGTKPIAYQIAATLENDGVSKTYIIGNYDNSVASAPVSLFCGATTADCLSDGATVSFPYPVEI